MVNFNDVLNTPVDSIEPPKPMPMGSYIWLVRRHELGESAQKKTPQVTFYCTPVQAMDDVDRSMLPENWNQKERRLTFYLTPDSLFRLTDFLGHLGLNTKGRTIGACIPETTNQQFIGTVVHSPGQRDPSKIYDNIESTAKVG